MSLVRTLILAAIIAPVGTAAANDVVPEHEKDTAQELGMEGPTETKGIEASVVLGSLPLGGEFPCLEGRILRMREVTVAPGGQVAVHQHQQRPGVAYVLEGEAYEHRNDRDEPVLRRAGDAAFENSGTIHWWSNESDASLRVIVVDVVPEGE